MTGPTRGLLDRTIFIAGETGRSLDTQQLPDQSAVSVITLAELHAGVLAATDTATRARRLGTLGLAGEMRLFGVDEAAARRWGELRVHLAELGRWAKLNDLWIAAIAVANDLPVVTQDADFDPLEGLLGLTVIRV